MRRHPDLSGCLLVAVIALMLAALMLLPRPAEPQATPSTGRVTLSVRDIEIQLSDPPVVRVGEVQVWADFEADLLDQRIQALLAWFCREAPGLAGELPCGELVSEEVEP